MKVQIPIPRVFPDGIQGSEFPGGNIHHSQVAGEGRATALDVGQTSKAHFKAPSFLIILLYIRDQWEEEKGFEQGNKVTRESCSMT